MELERRSWAAKAKKYSICPKFETDRTEKMKNAISLDKVAQKKDN